MPDFWNNNELVICGCLEIIFRMATVTSETIPLEVITEPPRCNRSNSILSDHQNENELGEEEKQQKREETREGCCTYCCYDPYDPCDDFWLSFCCFSCSSDDNSGDCCSGENDCCSCDCGDDDGADCGDCFDGCDCDCDD